MYLLELSETILNIFSPFPTKKKLVLKTFIVLKSNFQFLEETNKDLILIKKIFSSFISGKSNYF